jgi:hypothetical protein
MNVTTRCRLTQLLPVLAALLLADGIAAAQGPSPSVESILEGWKKRRERVQRIRYSVAGESIVPKGSQATDDLGMPKPAEPPQDVAQEQNVTFLLDMAHQRFRMELEGSIYVERAKALSPRVSVIAFDGRDIMTAMPRDRNTSSVHTPGPLDPDLMVSRGAKKRNPLNAVIALYQAPLLFAHGFVPQYAQPPAFDRPPDVDDFIVRGQATRDGRPCIIVKTFPLHQSSQTSWDEYWVDVERDCAVVRQLGYKNDKPIVDLEITYQETKQGWLPQRWTGTTRNQKGIVLNVTRQRVKEFVIDPAASDADYRLEAGPGMIILEDDYDSPKEAQTGPGFRRKTFRVAENGSWKELVIVNGAEQPSEEQVSWIRRHWLGLGLGLLGALLLGAGGLWVVRRRRRPPLQAAAPSA